MKHRILFDQRHHIAADRNIVMENQYRSLFRIYYNDLTKPLPRSNFIHRQTFFTTNALSTVVQFHVNISNSLLIKC